MGNIIIGRKADKIATDGQELIINRYILLINARSALYKINAGHKLDRNQQSLTGQPEITNVGLQHKHSLTNWQTEIEMKAAKLQKK